MKIITKTKNLELTDRLTGFVEEKFYGLKKFIDVLKEDEDVLPTLAEVFVEAEKETKHHQKGKIFIVKANVRLPGKSLIAEARSDDLYKAIIEAKEELKMEIEKYKLKNIDKNRRQKRKIKKEIDL